MRNFYALEDIFTIGARRGAFSQFVTTFARVPAGNARCFKVRDHHPAFVIVNLL